jgi:SAM-dependent MidA family methyltransferase
MANANLTLSDRVRARLRAAPNQRLPWAEIMRMALYEPGLGYYRRGVRRIGRGGDFYTSVSVGPLFGRLLAEFAYQTWCEMGRPVRFTIIEQGAHDGTLARDVLEGCRETSPEFFEAVQYAIIEPEPVLQEAQRKTLGGDLGAKLHHDREACAGPAVFICNELLDAFAVHRLRWDGSNWKEMWVSENEAEPVGLAFVEDELSAETLLPEVAGRGPGLPPGWTTEVCPAMASWLDDLARMPFTGPVLILDYGFTAAEHFAPERSDGTLRRYWQHRMDDKVLEELGNADLTAHVDFTRLTELAVERGLTVGGCTEQGRFLTRLFVDAFNRHGQAPDPGTQRQFHTLTHPGHMGRTFHALVLRKARNQYQ